MKSNALINVNENLFVDSSSTDGVYANIYRRCVIGNRRYIPRGNLDDNTNLLIEKVGQKIFGGENIYADPARKGHLKHRDDKPPIRTIMQREDSPRRTQFLYSFEKNLEGLRIVDIRAFILESLNNLRNRATTKPYLSV